MRTRALLLSLLVVSGCDSNGTGPDGGVRANVQVAFATTRAGQGAAFARVLFDDTLTSGSDTVIVSSAGLVLRKIELKRVEVLDCTGQGDNCEEFEAGPVLVMLPLNGSVESRFSLDIPEASYDEIEFEIHKVSGSDPEDTAFIQQHPEYADKSIRVQGTFNGTAFLYESDLNVEQELKLVPPLIVADTVPSTITILVDIDGWFRDGAGTLVDPVTGNKGQVNEGLIKENIKKSLEAFEDDDEDGKR